jgi:hypothetical protein
MAHKTEKYKYTEYLTFTGNTYLNTKAMISTFYTLGMNISEVCATLRGFLHF